MFWCCTNYPKCKGIVDARGTRIKLKELEMLDLDYNKLFQNGEIKRIICECTENDAKIKRLIQEYRDYQECLEDNNVCYGILEYLHKKRRYIDISLVMQGKLPPFQSSEI
jgi:ssDNA-binding Zn-finger/Zn-ribbon topoisomerase 1